MYINILFSVDILYLQHNRDIFILADVKSQIRREQLLQ